MIRSIDWHCACGYVLPDAMAAEDDTNTCTECGTQMEQDWLPRTRHNAQWDDATAVLVHVDPRTGDVRYPGTHDAKLKKGYERVYLRSLRDVERFESQHNVRSEMAWFDKGSGTSRLDDYIGKEKVTH